MEMKKENTSTAPQEEAQTKGISANEFIVKALKEALSENNMTACDFVGETVATAIEEDSLKEAHLPDSTLNELLKTLGYGVSYDVLKHKNSSEETMRDAIYCILERHDGMNGDAAADLAGTIAEFKSQLKKKQPVEQLGRA